MHLETKTGFQVLIVVAWKQVMQQLLEIFSDLKDFFLPSPPNRPYFCSFLLCYLNPGKCLYRFDGWLIRGLVLVYSIDLMVG